MLKSLFGKKLFKHNKPTVMYDFAQHGLMRPHMGHLEMAVPSDFMMSTSEAEGAKKKSKKKKEAPKITPKELYKLESLNDNDFAINTDSAYITKQIKNADKKLKLIYSNRDVTDEEGNIVQGDWWGGKKYARLELESIKQRLENRRRIDEFKEILEKYPHTSSAKVNDVLKDNSHLICNLATEFVPDMPDEAVEAMDEYNEMCLELTGLKTHFYVIAAQEDFQKKDRRRDPILLAQSPFGFFWQILGAWDEEMIFLGDL